MKHDSKPQDPGTKTEDLLGALLSKPSRLTLVREEAPTPVATVPDAPEAKTEPVKTPGPDPKKPWLYWAVYTYEPYAWDIHKRKLGYDVFHTLKEAEAARDEFARRDPYHADGYKIVPAKEDPKYKDWYQETSMDDIHEWKVEYYKERYDTWWTSGPTYETYEEARRAGEALRDKSASSIYRVRSRLTGAEYNLGRRKGWDDCKYCRGPCRRLFNGCDPNYITPSLVTTYPCGWC